MNMKFEEIREEYYVNTGKTSELIRQLAFAGIGMVWVYFMGEKPSPDTESYLLAPLLPLALCLFCDICQYLYASIAWERKYNEGVKKKLALDADLSVRKRINIPTRLFFYGKVVFLLMAYVMLIVNLVKAVA